MNKLHLILQRIYLVLKLILSSSCKANKVFLLGFPIHGNLGDQAILDSELTFLSEHSSNSIVLVESSIVRHTPLLVKRLVGKNDILVHGGGFLGSIWKNEEETFRTILKSFPENRIIVLPQTIFFDTKTTSDKRFLADSRNYYQSHNNLTIACREEFSYSFARKYFPKTHTILVPDMALYNPPKTANLSRRGALFCVRQDCEKITYDFTPIMNYLETNGIAFYYTDTVIPHDILTAPSRKKHLSRKIKEFSSAELIITDRLHGMVFAYLTKTPCLVFENSSYKVKGLYSWLEKASCNYIRLYKEDTLIEDLKYLLNLDEATSNPSYVRESFIPLIDIIK